MAKKRKVIKKKNATRKATISSAMRAELIREHIRMPHGYEIVPTKKRKVVKRKKATKKASRKRKK